MSPYIYQTLHVHRGEIKHLDRHTSLLDEGSRVLFGRLFDTNLVPLVQALRLRHHTEFVRVQVDHQGRIELLPAGRSLYEGYALRAMRPSACVFEYDIPYPEYPTSARWAAHELTTLIAQRNDAHVAIRCSSDGIIHTADDAPLYAVKGNRIYTSNLNGLLHVEQFYGMEFTEQPIGREQLSLFDELFYIDHRGVTAIGSCEGNVYADIVAERVAKTIG